MPVISLDYNDLIALLGFETSREELLEKIPMIGADIDRVEGDVLNIEFFPDRPDLYSIEGIARALRAFLGNERGMPVYTVKESDVEVMVDPSVGEVRPFVVGAVIKNVEMSDYLIKSLMDVQEKIHLTMGRKRKKVSIGVHDSSDITPPYTYKAVEPKGVRFVPLGKTEEWDLAEILTKHEKGVEYAFILEGKKRYPLILDSENNVLSFPPIINGTLTALNGNTEEVFIDITGTDLNAVTDALNILCTSMAERGAEIYSIKVKYGGDIGTITTPDLGSRSMELDCDFVNGWLGLGLSPAEIAECLRKMRFDASPDDKNKGKITVLIPAYRNDILHPVDLAEDAAIGYGYDRFKETLPEDHTYGKSLRIEEVSTLAKHVLTGLGYTEVITLILSSEHEQFTRMDLEPEEDIVKVKNPITKDHTCMRVSLVPSLLRTMAVNKHRELPHRIFEVGDVLRKERKRRMLGGAAIHAKAGFSEMKSVVEAVLRDFDVEYEIEPKAHNSFVEGRCAAIAVSGEEMGFFGELHPKVITNFELGYPLIAFELDLQPLLL